MTKLPTFSFQHSWVLLLLAVPIVLIVWIWRRNSGRVALPFDHSMTPRGDALRILINSSLCLAPIILAVAILILAVPIRFSAPKTRRALTNIQFCVDVSGSMGAQFGSGTRYDVSLEAINDFLDYRKGDAFGLTFFGNEVLHWVPLTQDASAFRCAPPFMRPGSLPPGFNGTEIGKALLACRDQLVEREEGDRMIILISDGFSADLNGDNDRQIAKMLIDQGITVYAVHISETEIPDPIINITHLTGGEVFSPGDTEALDDIFQRIDNMQETKLEKTRGETMDHFEPFCLLGMVALALAVVASYFLRYTPW